MSARFNKIKTSVQWDRDDQMRIRNLRGWLGGDVDTLTETLGEQLAHVKGTQSLMANGRFVQRLHDLLREWLLGLLEGTFDGEYVESRGRFGRKLVDLDLTFADLILLEELARCQLFEVVQAKVADPDALLETMQTLDKALSLDLALLYTGYLQVRDAQMEQVLLERFLRITGFSRTLYQNLAETREGVEAAFQ